MMASRRPDGDERPVDAPVRADDAGAWRFGEFELDGRRRVITRSGRRLRLSSRAFDVLLYLVRQRHRVVPRSELLARCWPRPDVTDGAVARVVMSLRAALGESDPQHGLIRTSPRAGYRFAGRCAGLRLALLPVDDRTGDASLAWVPLGLAEQLAACLVDRGEDGLVGVREVLGVLEDLPDRVRGEPRVRRVMQALGARAVLETRLVRQDGRCVLHLALHVDADGLPPAREATVVADQAVDTAGPAAALVAGWLTAPEGAPPAGASEDAFLDEAWRRASQCLRAQDHDGAAHLLAVLHDAGVEVPDLDLAQARLAVLRGRPDAARALQQLVERAQRENSPRLQAEAGLLHARRLEQQGRPRHALARAREAAAHAAAAGLGELRLRAEVMAARQLAQGIAPPDDGGAGESVHTTIERLRREVEAAGDRTLLRDACVVSGNLSALGEDWAAAQRHHAMGLAIAQALHESARAVPLSGLSQACLQQGRLRDARSLAEEAWRCARLGGEQPAQGQAALALAEALRALRQAAAPRELLTELDALQDDHTAVLQVARESRCRATLLCLAGRHDEALGCIARARHAGRQDPLLSAACVQDRVQVLLAAGRFGAVRALCVPLLAGRGTCLDPRTRRWLALALDRCGQPDRGAGGLDDLPWQIA